MSKHRRPHGQYTRETADWFVDRRMAGSAYSPPVVGKYGSVILYNDATDGSILHVVALNLCTFVAASIVNVAFHQGAIGTLQPNAVVPIGPHFLQLPGKIYLSSDPATFQLPAVAILGGTNNPQFWPHNFPLAYLNPGYALLCQTNLANCDFQAIFHWLAMGTNEGFY